MKTLDLLKGGVSFVPPQNRVGSYIYELKAAGNVKD
jgi:hypothetical protein